MALPAWVQQTIGNDSGFNNSVTTAAFGASTTSGNAIAVFVTAEGAAADITGVTDSKSNTYVAISGATATAAATYTGKWYLCQNITGGAAHTVSASDSGFVLASVLAIEISGLPTTGNILDGLGTHTSTGETVTTATLASATTNANDILLYGVLVGSGTATETIGSIGGTTGVHAQSGSTTSTATTSASGVQVVTSTGTFSGTFTPSVTNQDTVGVLVALSNTNIVTAVFLPQRGKVINQAINRAANF